MRARSPLAKFGQGDQAGAFRVLQPPSQENDFRHTDHSARPTGACAPCDPGFVTPGMPAPNCDGIGSIACRTSAISFTKTGQTARMRSTPYRSSRVTAAAMPCARFARGAVNGTPRSTWFPFGASVHLATVATARDGSKRATIGRPALHCDVVGRPSTVDNPLRGTGKGARFGLRGTRARADLAA